MVTTKESTLGRRIDQRCVNPRRGGVIGFFAEACLNTNWKTALATIPPPGYV
jgi:hypothetical protein